MTSNEPYGVIEEIRDHLRQIDLGIHGHHTIPELEAELGDVLRKTEGFLNRAKSLCVELGVEVSFLHSKNENKGDADSESTINDDYYKLIEQCTQKLRLAYRSVDEWIITDEDFINLFESYATLDYTFESAFRYSKNYYFKLYHLAEKKPDKNLIGTVDTPTASITSFRVIQLCKNIRIMEDLINKICTNNIDKSIITGEQHFESLKDGFKWLFCHTDSTDSDENNHRINIRDRYRYLDYLKYQILAVSKSLPSLTKSTTEIDQLYEKIKERFEQSEFNETKEMIFQYKQQVEMLIDNFFDVYKLMIKYRDAHFQEEDIRNKLAEERLRSGVAEPVAQSSDGSHINDEIWLLSFVAVRILLDRFVSFVKITNLNFGNSNFYRSWFNYSELSKGNYAGCNFQSVRIENGKMKNCDISTCDLSMADGDATDFSGSNFNYSNLIGMNLIDSIVNSCEFQNAIFRDENIDRYSRAIGDFLEHQPQNRTSDYSSEFPFLLKAIDFWGNKSQLDGNALKSIIDTYRHIECTDLTIGNPGDKNLFWKILDCDSDMKRRIFDENHERISFYDRMVNLTTDVLTLNLRKHIPAEVLAWFKKERNNDQMKKIYNKYGKAVPDTAKLRGITAKETQMSGCDLCHVDFAEASFENSDLSDCQLHYTRADNASFIYSNLNRSRCFESNFYSANFSNAVMNDAVFLNCKLSHTNWNKAIMIGTEVVNLSSDMEQLFDKRINWIHLQVQDCVKFQDKSAERGIQYVILDNPVYKQSVSDNSQSGETMTFWQKTCSINDSSFNEVLADNLVFINILVDRCSFNRASLKSALVANCRMYLSDFIGADFRYSNLVLSCMGQSNFRDANLTNCVIRYVDFSNGNFMGTLFNLSQLNHVLFQNANLETANFSSATVENCAFDNCRFNSVNMTDTHFRNCIFSFINFKEITGTHSAKLSFESCFFYNCSVNDKDRDDGVYDRDKFFFGN